MPGGADGSLWLRFLSGPDIDSLGISNAEIVDAVEGAVRAHGAGQAMTAVGARYLARPDSRVLGHVGARGTARRNVVLLDALFDRSCAGPSSKTLAR